MSTRQDVRSVPTFCRICEAACGLIAEVGADSTIVRVRPDRDHPVSRGFACAKGTGFHQTARGPRRLSAPLVRGGDGKLAVTDWESAYAHLGALVRPILDRHGPQAVGIYFGNPMAFNALGSAALLALIRAMGTRNVFAAGSQDCNNKFVGADIVHGSPLIHPIPDFAHTDLAVLFGTNPVISQSSFVHLEGGSTVFDSLKARGGRVVIIDPRRSESARRWGEHIPIRAGTDAVLMLALLHELRDLPVDPAHTAGLSDLLAWAATVPPERAAPITGIAAADIRALAGALREAPSAAVHMSVGVNQGPFGTLAYVLAQAISFVTGNMDRRGGHLFHPLAIAAAGPINRLRPPHGAVRSRIGGFPAVLGSFPAGILADEIETPGEGQIRALVVVGGDPLGSVPDAGRLARAFGRLEALAVIDTFANRTSERAHVVLPAASWLERWDFATTTAFFQQSPWLAFAGPVLPPHGQSRPDHRILLEVSVAIGRPALGSATLTRTLARHVNGQLLDRLARVAGRTHSRARNSVGRGLVRIPVPEPGTYLGRGPRTPEHRLRFWHPLLESERTRLAEFMAVEAEANGFRLIGRRRRLGHNGWLHGSDADAAALMSADDIRRLGLVVGDLVRIQSEAGVLVLPAVADPGVAAGTVVVPHGLPDHNVNVLIPSGPAKGRIEPLSGQHRMTGIPVDVTAA